MKAEFLSENWSMPIRNGAALSEPSFWKTMIVSGAMLLYLNLMVWRNRIELANFFASSGRASRGKDAVVINNVRRACGFESPRGIWKMNLSSMRSLIDKPLNGALINPLDLRRPKVNGLTSARTQARIPTCLVISMIYSSTGMVPMRTASRSFSNVQQSGRSSSLASIKFHQMLLFWACLGTIVLQPRLLGK